MTSVTQKEILGEAERLEVKNKAPIVLCELLFDEKMFKEKQISKHKNLFLRCKHHFFGSQTLHNSICSCVIKEYSDVSITNFYVIMCLTRILKRWRRAKNVF